MFGVGQVMRQAKAASLLAVSWVGVGGQGGAKESKQKRQCFFHGDFFYEQKKTIKRLFDMTKVKVKNEKNLFLSKNLVLILLLLLLAKQSSGTSNPLKNNRRHG